MCFYSLWLEFVISVVVFVLDLKKITFLLVASFFLIIIYGEFSFFFVSSLPDIIDFVLTYRILRSF